MDASVVTIYTTVIVEAAGIIGLLIKQGSERKKAAVEQAKRDQRIDDSIRELSKRVDAHNGLSDRIANIEKACVRTDTRLENIENRLK